MKPLYPTAESQVQALWKNYAGTLLWCFAIVLTHLMYLDMGLANWSKSHVLAANYPCGVLLPKKWKLTWSEEQRFVVFLLVDWVCYSFVTVRGVAHGEYYGLEFCGATCSEVWQGKQWWLWQIKPIDRCLVKHVCYIKYLNGSTADFLQFNF